jgi:hypothetical protein
MIYFYHFLLLLASFITNTNAQCRNLVAEYQAPTSRTLTSNTSKSQ